VVELNAHKFFVGCQNQQFTATHLGGIRESIVDDILVAHAEVSSRLAIEGDRMELGFVLGEADNDSARVLGDVNSFVESAKSAIDSSFVGHGEAEYAHSLVEVRLLGTDYRQIPCRLGKVGQVGERRSLSGWRDWGFAHEGFSLLDDGLFPRGLIFVLVHCSFDFSLEANAPIQLNFFIDVFGLREKLISLFNQCQWSVSCLIFIFLLLFFNFWLLDFFLNFLCLGKLVSKCPRHNNLLKKARLCIPINIGIRHSRKR
jgi:hypothetical protein